jgi:hypothetical protein
LDEVKSAKEDILQIFEDGDNYGVSIQINTNDGQQTSFYEGGAVLNSESGLSTEL